MKRLLQFLAGRFFLRWIFACAVFLIASTISTIAALDTSSHVAFFTSTADQFLKAQPEFAGLSSVSIPIYPLNGYTPAVHRIFQLAANLGDARVNKTSVAPDDFDYPSVFRPTFGVSVVGVVTNVFINGWVEVGTNADYLPPPLSLPDDLALVGPNTTNIYGVPWIIGARKGLPNFNEISIQSITQIARKLQIVKPSIGAARSTWHTNVQYTLGISNAVGIEAWNSYRNNYTRPVDILIGDYLTMVLTNELGLVLSTNVILGRPLTISNWPGFTPFVTNSFIIPVMTNVAFLPTLVYKQNGTLTKSTTFETTTGFPQPLFGFNVTNRLRFIMLDYASGRVIDYVHLDGLNQRRRLTEELPGFDVDYGGPGGVWDTNRVGNSTSTSVPVKGMVNQVDVSLHLPTYSVPGYPTPVTSNDWGQSPLPGGFSFVAAAVSAFSRFINGADTSNLVMQVPFTPVRTVSRYFTWQANDPLVHYTLSDLTGINELAPPDNGTTNYLDNNPSISNSFLPNVGKVNNRYLPWNGQGNPTFELYSPIYLINPALKDPQVFSSDDGDFPVGQLDFGVVGRVHRGTPWQTVYLKADAVDGDTWSTWTGYGNAWDAVVTRPTNDWRLAGALARLLNPFDPRKLFSVNHTNLAVAMNGMTAISNSSPPMVLEMTADSQQAATIAAGINAVRAGRPGGLFPNVSDILSVPQLSTQSPWLDHTLDDTTDEEFETIPSQLLPFLRPDSIGSLTVAAGVVQVQFTGLDDYLYQIEVSTDLQHWTTVAIGSPTNGVLQFTEPANDGSAARYYRSVLLPNF